MAAPTTPTPEAQPKWQIWFQSPEMAAEGHTQAGRVFKYRERAEAEAAEVASREGWTAEVRPKVSRQQPQEEAQEPQDDVQEHAEALAGLEADIRASMQAKEGLDLPSLIQDLLAEEHGLQATLRPNPTNTYNSVQVDIAGKAKTIGYLYPQSKKGVRVAPALTMDNLPKRFKGFTPRAQAGKFGTYYQVTGPKGAKTAAAALAYAAGLMAPAAPAEPTQVTTQEEAITEALQDAAVEAAEVREAQKPKRTRKAKETAPEAV